MAPGAPGPSSDPASAKPSAWRLACGTVLGVGRLPFGPGTWGSLVTVLIVVVLYGVEGLGPGVLPNAAGDVSQLHLAMALVLSALLLLGCWVGAAAEVDYGVHDPGAFVLDEVVGQGLALWPVLTLAVRAGHSPTWIELALAFAVFRVFDILKPPPVRQAERLPGGVGIMADDVVAGLIAMVVVWFVFAGGG